MKRKLETIIKFGLGFVGMVVLYWSCSTDPGKAGYGLLPVGDLIKVNRVVETQSLKAYTQIDGNLRTDEPNYALIGTYNDSIFGKTTADFACQLRLASFPDFTKDDIFDSLVFYIAYKEVYGDTITPQKFKVYELGSDIYHDEKYYQDVDLKSMAKPEVLAEMNYTPKFKLDSLTSTYGSTKADPKDTVVHEIAFHLSETFAHKLMSTDSVTLSDNDKFLQYFKGLYVESGDLNQGGAILRATGSGMVLYYRKDNDTTKYSHYFYITSSSARISKFTHDYSTTTFASELGNTDTEDSLIYLQTTGGLKSKILIPTLDNWADSSNFVLNKAELIFQVDTTVTNVYWNRPPAQLVLTAIDSVGGEYLPSDVAFSQVYYDGTYYSKDHTYRFNIAKHMLEAINSKKQNKNLKYRNFGFYLSTAFRNSQYRRTILKGPSSKTGIRFEVTYSKLN